MSLSTRIGMKFSFWWLSPCGYLIFFQATLGFFTLASEPVDVVNPLIDNLITLLCTILLTRYLTFEFHMFLLIFYLLNKPSLCPLYKVNDASLISFEFDLSRYVVALLWSFLRVVLLLFFKQETRFHRLMKVEMKYNHP